MKYMLAFLLLTSTLPGYSQGQIFQIDHGNNFAAAIISEKFNYYQAFQDKDNWCWAACIQMVLDYQGMRFPGSDKEEQCQIVKKAFNTNHCENQPAGCYTIQSGASGWVVNGRVIKAEVDNTVSADELVRQLAYKNPVLIGLNQSGSNIGHAYVLTAVYYRESTTGNKNPYKVALRDPWPYDKYGIRKDPRQEFTWNDFVSRLNCITYVTF